jgi:glycosyltransferase 2 family protein
MVATRGDAKNRALTIFRWGTTLLTSALFLWLISRQNWELVIKGASGIGWGVTVAALGFQMSSYLFNNARWFVYLISQRVKIGYWQAMRLTMSANFASNFLPSTVGGDTIRMIALLGYTDRKVVAFGSVILDRLTNMAAMACLLPVSWITFKPVGLLMGASLISAPRVREKIANFTSEIREAVKVWAGHPWAFFLAFLIAWPSNLLPMLASFLIAKSLGIDVTYLQVIGVQTLTYFISTLPISIGGYGVREMAYTALYMALGATVEQSLSLALITRFFMLITSLPGAIWLPQSLTKFAQTETKLT